MLCTFLTAMLLVSSVALGTILNNGPGAYSDVEASAAGSNDYVVDSHSGWYYEYTDTGGTFSWDYSLSADAEARVTLQLDEWASATAIADAEVTGADSNDVFQSASVSGTGTYDGEYFEDDPDEPDTESGGDYGPLNAYEGIAGDSDALAVAQIDEGSDCMAYAAAIASADVNLYD